MGGAEGGEVVVQERQQLRAGGAAAEVALAEHGDDLVIGPVIRRVGETASTEPPDVAVAARADMIQLVDQCVQLLLKREIEEPRQIHRENIPLLPGATIEPLDRPGLAVPLGGQLAAFKTQRRQLGEHPVRRTTPSLAERQGDAVHLHMPQIRHLGRQIVTDSCEGCGDVEPWEGGESIRWLGHDESENILVPGSL